MFSTCLEISGKNGNRTKVMDALKNVIFKVVVLLVKDYHKMTGSYKYNNI